MNGAPGVSDGRLEGGCAGFGYGLVLLAAASGDADGSDDFAVLLEGDAASKDHDLAVIGGVDAEELLAGLGVVAEVLGGDVEGAGGPGLFLGDVDGAEPGVGHALEGEEVSALVDDGDVHGLADLLGLMLCGGDDAACVLKLDHG
jgi:hypothetical protein